MSGGLFLDRPFRANIKCVWFAIIMMLYYYYATETPNTWILPVIAVVSYVALAWYDYVYSCSDTLYPGGLFNWTAIFKPEPTTHELDMPGTNNGNAGLADDQRSAFLRAVYIFHALIIAPFLIYIGYYGASADPRSFGVLLALGALALLYHGVRIFVPRQF